MLFMQRVLLAGFWCLLEQGMNWLAEPGRLHHVLVT
jgi:hypothetical protein